MFAELMERLTIRKVKLEETRGKQFRQISLDVADGKNFDTDKLLDRLEELHKTPEDLQLAVTRIKERRIDQQKIRDAEAAKLELSVVKREIDAELARFAPLESEHEATMNSLSFRDSRCSGSINSASGVRERLFHSCEDPALLEKYNSFKQSTVDLSKEIERLKAERKGVKNSIDTEVQKARGLLEYEETLNRDHGPIERFIKRGEEQLAVLDARIVAAEKDRMERSDRLNTDFVDLLANSQL